jgi:RNA polymerase sigma-70 factor, ECF subfamily
LHQQNGVSKALAAKPRPQLQDLLDRYMTLWEQADIPGLAALLREDAWFTMPPISVWYQGRAAIAAFFQSLTFTYPDKWRLLPTHANGSPAFGMYRWNAEAGTHQLLGLMVLEVVGEQISNIVVFLDLPTLSPFALPPIFPDTR